MFKYLFVVMLVCTLSLFVESNYIFAEGCKETCNPRVGHHIVVDPGPTIECDDGLECEQALIKIYSAQGCVLTGDPVDKGGYKCVAGQYTIDFWVTDCWEGFEGHCVSKYTGTLDFETTLCEVCE